MTVEEILSRNAYLLTFELKVFWSVAFLYAAASFVFALYAFTQRASFSKAGYVFLCAAVTLQSALLVLRTLEAGRAPFQTLYETLSWFAWSSAIAYLFVSRRWQAHFPALFVSILSSGACFYALTSRAPSLDPLPPALQSWWFEWHVALAFLSYAVLVVSFAIEATTLISKPFVKRGKEFFDLTAENIPERKRTAYNLVLFGFPLLTFAIFSGAAWANEAWGRYWSWDPKETWSIITWTVFAMYLHSMSIPRWRGIASVLNIIGFVSMMMTFLGVNWLSKLLGIPSLHVYAV